MTPDEIISAINHSQVPTLLVEGVQDCRALRLIEDLLNRHGAILKCEGRSNLFDVWRRRGEILGDRSVVFMADKDLYVLQRIPSEYAGIIFTDGYSLENDILESKRWMKLHSSEDSKVYDSCISLAIDHFWEQVFIFYHRHEAPVWLSTHQLKAHGFKLSEKMVRLKSTCPIFRRINRNPIRYVRGKNVLDCVFQSLSYEGRSPRYRKEHILEFSIKPNPKGKLRLLVSKLTESLDL